jgi:hypothetical protein
MISAIIYNIRIQDSQDCTTSGADFASFESTQVKRFLSKTLEYSSAAELSPVVHTNYPLDRYNHGLYW